MLAARKGYSPNRHFSGVYQCLAHYREGFGLDVVLRRNEVRFFYVFGIELRLINELINGDDVLGRNA